jgi:hypothetical protein
MNRRRASSMCLPAQISEGLSKTIVREREVIGERIRDKFAASRKRGMWMGGWAPLDTRSKTASCSSMRSMPNLFARSFSASSRSARPPRWLGNSSQKASATSTAS